MRDRTITKCAGVLALALASLLLASSAGAATITVNTVADAAADDGTCTLREAMTSANNDSVSGAAPGECNAGSGADVIAFAIPGGGLHLIAPSTSLPGVITPMTIDGSTGTGQIAIDGGGTLPTGFEIVPGADGSTLRDLTVVRWAFGIQVNGADGVTISASRIGTNLNGSAGFGNSARGIDVVGDANGTVISDNVISGNGLLGIRAGAGVSASPIGTRITGNLIGITPDGTVALPNGDGIVINDSPDTEIGGPGAGDGNVISGNTGRGVVVAESSVTGMSENTLVQGNLIGTGSGGLTDLGNGTTGVYPTGDVRRTSLIDNLISGNGGDGALLDSDALDLDGPSETVFRGNRIGTGLDDATAIGNGGAGI